MENVIEYDSSNKRKRNLNEEFQGNLKFVPSDKSISSELRSLLNIEINEDVDKNKKKKLNNVL
jgi:hypothetical protein